MTHKHAIFHCAGLSGILFLAACASGPGHLEQGQTYYHMGEYEQAIEQFGMASSRHPGPAEYWTGRSYEAMALDGESEYLDQAFEHYSIAAQRGSYEASFRLGQIWMAFGEPDKGLPMIQTAAVCGVEEARLFLIDQNLPVGTSPNCQQPRNLAPWDTRRPAAPSVANVPPLHQQ